MTTTTSSRRDEDEYEDEDEVVKTEQRKGVTVKRDLIRLTHEIDGRVHGMAWHYTTIPPSCLLWGRARANHNALMCLRIVLTLARLLTGKAVTVLQGLRL